MRFRGWWVDGRSEDVTVQSATFDDTELSEGSGWKEAHQNGDQAWASGFIEPLPMLRDVCRRLLDPVQDEAPRPSGSGEGDAAQLSIRSAQDLARLLLSVTA